MSRAEADTDSVSLYLLTRTAGRTSCMTMTASFSAGTVTRIGPYTARPTFFTSTSCLPPHRQQVAPRSPVAAPNECAHSGPGLAGAPSAQRGRAAECAA